MCIQWMVRWWVPVHRGPLAVPKEIMFLQTQKPHLSIVHILCSHSYSGRLCFLVWLGYYPFFN
jgi:hypothetical protein